MNGKTDKRHLWLARSAAVLRRLATAVLPAITVMFICTQVAVAAETGADWRPTYDLALRWVNFAILVFLILKYARKPLVNFFKEKSEDVKKEIQEVEKEKAAILAKVEALLKERDRSQERLEALKARIISQGKANKQRIIDDARNEGKIMLEGAQRKVQSKLMSAHANIRAELIDYAVDLAMQKLPTEITEKDNQNLYETYLKSTEGL